MGQLHPLSLAAFTYLHFGFVSWSIQRRLVTALMLLVTVTRRSLHWLLGSIQ